MQRPGSPVTTPTGSPKEDSSICESWCFQLTVVIKEEHTGTYAFIDLKANVYRCFRLTMVIKKKTLAYTFTDLKANMYVTIKVNLVAVILLFRLLLPGKI